MTVYIDSLFLLNAFLNYLLLLGGAWLGGLPARRLRFLAAAVLGGLYAAGCVLWASLQALPWKLASLALMLLVAEGPRRSAVRLGAVFLLLCLAFGGLVLVLLNAFGTGLLLIGGAAYYPVSAPALALTAAAAYLLARTVLARLAQHTGALVEIELRLGGRSARLTALRDTGNTLRDPVTNRGVLVAGWRTLCALLPPAAAEGLDGAAFTRPESLLERLVLAEPAGKWRLIPYRAVGAEGRMLLAMRCDAARVGKRTVRGALVAFSPNEISDGGGSYAALMGGSL